MIFTTHHINKPKELLVVENIGNTFVDIITKSGERFRLDRFLVSTPIMTCRKCGMPADLKRETNSKKEYAECPDHFRHMYEALFAASHDMKHYNRKQRREFYKQAGKWLSRWQKVFEIRMEATKN